MLIKLIKWDLRATYKKYVAVLTTFALLCIALPNVFFTINPDAGRVCSLFTFSLGLTTLCIVLFVFILQYYNTSLYGDEGYITFALPTAGWRLLLAKMFSALFWMLVTSVLIGFAGFTSMNILKTDSQLNTLFASAWDIGHFDAANWVMVGALLILSSANCILITYFSISVSKLSIWRKGGVAMGFVTFVVICIVQALPALFLKGDVQYLTGAVYQSGTSQIVKMSQVYTIQQNGLSMIVDSSVSLIIFLATTRLLDKTTNLK